MKCRNTRTCSVSKTKFKPKSLFQNQTEQKNNNINDFCKISWCSFRGTYKWVSSNLAYQDQNQPSKWNSVLAKIPKKFSHVENEIHFLFGTNLLQACQLLEQNSRKTQNQFSKKNTFKNCYESADSF